MVHIEQYHDARQRGEGGMCDFTHSFSQIRRYFFDSDIVVGNLETVLAGDKVGFKDYPCFAVPDDFAYALKDAGFNLITTANNHCMDWGCARLLRTTQVLECLGIMQIGTYVSQEARDTITIIEKGSIRFAFLSYTLGTNGIYPCEGYMVNMLDEELFTADIKHARSMDVDFIIVLPHMGIEYETQPDQQHKDIVMKMLESGADIVLASHPHTLQPAEFITITDEGGNSRLCFVAYSLGNFISGQREQGRDAGVIFNLYFEKPKDSEPILKTVSFIPTWVRFIKDGKLDVAVLSVYDVISTDFWGGDTGLSKYDLNRVYDVLRETSTIITGAEIYRENIEIEYFITPRQSL